MVSNSRTSSNVAKSIACARILASDRGFDPSGSRQKDFRSNSDTKSLGRPWNAGTLI